MQGCAVCLCVALVWHSGVSAATRLRLNPRQRASHALFKTYLDVVHVQKEETDKLFRPRGANTTQAGGQHHHDLFQMPMYNDGITRGGAAVCAAWVPTALRNVAGRVWHCVDSDSADARMPEGSQ